MGVGGVSDGREYHQAQPWNGKSRDHGALVPVRFPNAENFDQRQVRGFASELFLCEPLCHPCHGEHYMAGLVPPVTQGEDLNHELTTVAKSHEFDII